MSRFCGEVSYPSMFQTEQVFKVAYLPLREMQIPLTWPGIKCICKTVLFSSCKPMNSTPGAPYLRSWLRIDSSHNQNHLISSLLANEMEKHELETKWEHCSCGLFESVHVQAAAGSLHRRLNWHFRYKQKKGAWTLFFPLKHV